MVFEPHTADFRWVDETGQLHLLELGAMAGTWVTACREHVVEEVPNVERPETRPPCETCMLAAVEMELTIG